MSKFKYIIGDVHGCYKTLLALIKKLPNGEKSDICFVGDVIDRGKNSAEVIELIINQKYECVLGNHEHRLLAFEREFLKGKKVCDERWFYQNGGAKTFASYEKYPNLKEKHIGFLKTLPLFLEYQDIKTADDRYLVVSHSAVGEMWALRSDESKKDEFKKHVICGRGDNYENKDIFNIYGHTPIESPKITNFSANIDLGCVYKYKLKNPRLCAIEFPSLNIFTQKNIES